MPRFVTEEPSRWDRFWKWLTAISTIGGIISTGILLAGSVGFVLTVIDWIVGIGLPWEDFPAALAFAAAVVLALVTIELRTIDGHVRALGAKVEVLLQQMPPPEPPGRKRQRVVFRNQTRWLVAHDLGYVPEIEARDMKGKELIPIARENTAERTMLTFANPTTGSLDLR